MPSSQTTMTQKQKVMIGGIVLLVVVVLLIITLAVILSLAKRSRSRSRPKSQSLLTPSFPAFSATSPTAIILLTCTVQPPGYIGTLKQRDSDSRLQTYMTSLAQWAKVGPGFRVVVVENSGYEDLGSSFPTIETITFDEATDTDLKLTQPWFKQTDRSKGAHELASVRVALARSSTIRAAHPHTWIIKITGRFFVPDLHQHLVTDQAQHASGVRQQDPDQCQIVGCRLAYADALFRGVSQTNIHIESVYKARLARDDWAKDRVLALPTLPIPTTLGGGHLTPFTSL